MNDVLKQIKNPNSKSENWIKYLYYTNQKNYNVEHLTSLKDNSNKLVYNYVIRSIEILNSKNIDNEKTKYYVLETLKYMDISKTGDKEKIKEWKKKGYNLYVHNEASAMIYKDECTNYDKIVYVLIKTHGLLGQYLRGEVLLSSNRELYSLIEEKLISKDELRKVLVILNECIIGAVDINIYNKIKDDINNSIEKVINNEFDHEFNILEKLNRLNGNTLSKQEESELNDLVKNKTLKNKINNLINKVDFWYYEVALKDFTLLEQIKILLICFNNLKDEKHLTFDKLSKNMYIDYENKKVINIYKKRIIEYYLNELKLDDILENRTIPSPHIKLNIKRKNDTIIFDFKLSIQAEKLTEFCIVANNSSALYKKAVYMLYDLFGFRKDMYDRFYNEISYLNTMNASIMFKAKLLDYIKGKSVLDVGPGGGTLMDLICEKNPNLEVYGIDISSNVIDNLNKKKKEENRKWNIIKGDALNLEDYFEKNKIDTIIYSSIIHELYSYIPYEGKKFNINTVKKALKSAYDILPIKGRIIIRDGIKTEPENTYRIIEFKNKDDINILKRYCKDFEGRCITYERISDNKVKMLVNDAMEFLYTYTWGEDSYPLEVKEQFGYLTPSQYRNLINENLPNSKIITSHAFLQDGYEENLLNKITIYDCNMNVVKLPNSTFIMVIEKEK